MNESNIKNEDYTSFGVFLSFFFRLKTMCTLTTLTHIISLLQTEDK